MGKGIVGKMKAIIGDKVVNEMLSTRTCNL